MNDIMFELNNLMGSVITGWFDDKMVAGYNRIQEEKEVLENAIEKDWLVSDDAFQLEKLFDNVEKAYMLRYGFFKIVDVSMQKGFETPAYHKFKTENNLW